MKSPNWRISPGATVWPFMSMERGSQMPSPRLVALPRNCHGKQASTFLFSAGRRTVWLLARRWSFSKIEDAADFMYRMKQSGQLASKMRFLAAQWLGLLSDGKWLEYARHANAMAERLYSKLSQVAAIKLLFPREGNAVFAKIPDPVVARLYELGWRFYTRCWSGRRSPTDVFLGYHGRRCRSFCEGSANRFVSKR